MEKINQNLQVQREILEEKNLDQKIFANKFYVLNFQMNLYRCHSVVYYSRYKKFVTYESFYVPVYTVYLVHCKISVSEYIPFYIIFFANQKDDSKKTAKRKYNKKNTSKIGNSTDLTHCVYNADYRGRQS